MNIKWNELKGLFLLEYFVKLFCSPFRKNLPPILRLKAHTDSRWHSEINGSVFQQCFGSEYDCQTLAGHMHTHYMLIHDWLSYQTHPPPPPPSTTAVITTTAPFSFYVFCSLALVPLCLPQEDEQQVLWEQYVPLLFYPPTNLFLLAPSLSSSSHLPPLLNCFPISPSSVLPFLPLPTLPPLFSFT